MLGRDVTEAASAAGHEVIALGRGDLDITDRDAAMAAIAAAAPTASSTARRSPTSTGPSSRRELAQAVNGVGAGHVAAAAAAADAWVLHVSTDYVFDGRKRTPYLESDPVDPESEYGRSKQAGEAAVAETAPAGHTIVRSSWLFGAHGPLVPGDDPAARRRA